MKTGGRSGNVRNRGLARRKQGTTLIFALVVLAVAAMVLAGTVVVMGALVEHTVASQTAMSRRVQLENSRMLAVQFLREKVFSGTSVPVTAGVTNTNVTSGSYFLGGVSLAGSGSSVWTGTSRPAGSNPFVPVGDTLTIVSGNNYYRSGYVTTISGTLWSGTFGVPWNFEARTRTPTLGYDLANYVGSGTAANVTSVASIGATNGPYFSGTLLNSAFPTDLTITGTRYASEVASVATALSVSGSGADAYHRYNNGAVEVFLNGPDTVRTFSVSGSLRSLVFSSSGAYTPTSYPLRIVFSNLTVSSTITHNGARDRPVHLIFSSTLPYTSAQPVTLNYSSTARITAMFVNVPGTVQNGTIQGGIFVSSGTVTVSGGGTLSIVRETDPGTLDEMTLRRGWVESYRND